MNAPLIQVANLTFAYTNGPPVLNQVQIAIAEGESLGLAGANGAGKSTLLLCLAGVMPIPAGKIQVDGLDPAIPADRRALPTRLGMLFQKADDQLIHATVADDVAFGPLNLDVPIPEVTVRVQAALEQVGLVNARDRSPHRLSGGEKRRAALAGVMAMQPKILLLDEPSSDLDARGRSELVQLLNKLAISKVIASHDLDLLRRTCQRIVIMNNGCIVADGATTAILDDYQKLAEHGLA